MKQLIHSFLLIFPLLACTAGQASNNIFLPSLAEVTSRIKTAAAKVGHELCEDASTIAQLASTHPKISLAMGVAAFAGYKLYKKKINDELLHAVYVDAPNLQARIDRLIFWGADVNANRFGSTVLHRATLLDGVDAEVVQLLIARGADINAKDGRGSTPLHYVYDTVIAQHLIDHGAHIDAKDRDGYTPLHRATLPIMCLLIAHGADVHEKNNDGDTPLHIAVWCSSEAGIRLLLAHGTEINAKNNSGSTPLHLAVFWNHLGLIQLLLEHGADPFIENNERKSAIHIAQEKGLINHGIIGQLLQKMKANRQLLPSYVSPYIHFSQQLGSRVTQDILEWCPAGTEFNERINRGKSPAAIKTREKQAIAINNNQERNLSANNMNTVD